MPCSVRLCVSYSHELKWRSLFCWINGSAKHGVPKMCFNKPNRRIVLTGNSSLINGGIPQNSDTMMGWFCSWCRHPQCESANFAGADTPNDWGHRFILGFLASINHPSTNDGCLNIYHLGDHLSGGAWNPTSQNGWPLSLCWHILKSGWNMLEPLVTHRLPPTEMIFPTRQIILHS